MRLLPKPSYKNTRALTLYTILIGGLLWITHFIFAPRESGSGIAAFAENLQTEAFDGVLLMGLFFIMLSLIGLIVLVIYWLFISHTHDLRKPREPFLNYYFITILWIGAFLTAELYIFLGSLFFTPTLSEVSALLINLAFTLGVNVLGLLLMYHYLRGSHTKILTWLKKLIQGEPQKPLARLILWGALGYAAVFPIFGIASGINQLLLGFTGREFPLQPLVTFSLNNQNLFITILMFASIALVAPFFEEILMRGLIFRGLLKALNPARAMLVSGLVFAAFHFNIFSFIPIAVLGFFLAWLYHRSGSLIPGMVAHALFNTLNFMFLQLLK